MVSGAGGLDWDEVAAFCEARRLPCVFPSLERAPANASRRHASLYLSGGVDAEASLLARWLATRAAVDAPRRLLSLSSRHDAGADAANQALVRAFRPHKVVVQAHSADSATLAHRLAGLPDALDPVVLADVHAATYFFADAMARMREGLSADYLLEGLEAAVDLRPAGAAYFRLSLAPGQRIAAQGGHLLGFVAGTPPRLKPLGSFVQAPLAD